MLTRIAAAARDLLRPAPAPLPVARALDRGDRGPPLELALPAAAPCGGDLRAARAAYATGEMHVTARAGCRVTATVVELIARGPAHGERVLAHSVLARPRELAAGDVLVSPWRLVPTPGADRAEGGLEVVLRVAALVEGRAEPVCVERRVAET